jgi:hypothetical protein
MLALLRLLTVGGLLLTLFPATAQAWWHTRPAGTVASYYYYPSAYRSYAYYPAYSYSYYSPVYSYYSPVYSYSAPVYSYYSPTYSYSPPVYTYSSPVYTYSARIYTYSPPVYTSAASPVYVAPPLCDPPAPTTYVAPASVPSTDARVTEPTTHEAKKPADRCTVSFWNQGDRDLTLRIEGQARVLARGRGLTLDLPREFVWQTDGRPAQTERIPAGETNREIPLR